MMKPVGGRRSGGSLIPQVMFVVKLAQSVVLTLIGGRGAPESKGNTT